MGIGKHQKNVFVKKRIVREEDTSLLEKMGTALHPIANSGMVVVKINCDKFPHFNTGVYTKDKKKVATVDEIFGKTDDILMSVSLIGSLTYEDIKDSELYVCGNKIMSMDLLKGRSGLPLQEKMTKVREKVDAREWNRSNGRHQRKPRDNRDVQRRVPVDRRREGHAKAPERRNKVTKFTD